MKKDTAVSDEELISAILSNGTFKAAAEATGLTTRAIYDRMKDRTFREMYDQAKTDLLRETMNGLNIHLTNAVNTIAEVMNNSENNPAVRLQAAQYIISNVTKLSAQLDKTEEEIKTRHEAFSLF